MWQPAAAVFCALLLALPSSAGAADAPLRVGAIRVETTDVYTDEEASAGWPYRALNALHADTRTATVGKFLLFREGDPFDPAVLVETERNLRGLPFIKSASVTASPPRDGRVDITVRTQDTWTTEPTVVVGREGGVTTFGASFLERNLLGTGRQVGVTYDEGVDRITRSLSFSDPNLLGPYRSGSVLHAANSDGWQDLVAVERPFSSTGTARAGRIAIDASSAHDRIYREGFAVARFRHDRHAVLAEAGAAFARTPTSAWRLTAGFLAERDQFTTVAGRPADPHPPSREHRYLYFRGERVHTKLVKLDYVDRDARFDDFDLGLRVSTLAGVSPPWFGLDRTVGLVGLGVSDGWRPGTRTLLLPRLSLESRMGDVTNHTVLDLEARFLHRFGGPLPQTLVSRLEILRGWDLDPETQFFADGSTALRGYDLRGFEGDRTIVLNVEHRVFAGREILRMVSPGAALFFDAGLAASSDRDIRWPAVRSDVGLGLRIALPRTSVHTLFRLDAAWPLQADRDGRRHVLVSFSNSQAF